MDSKVNFENVNVERKLPVLKPIHATWLVEMYNFFANAQGRVHVLKGWEKAGIKASSETQGQLVGTTGFSWTKVYNKSGRAPGHLLLPNEFQKRLKSRLLIGQKNISEEEQPATLMSSYTRLFSSSNAVVAWPVQREHF